MKAVKLTTDVAATIGITLLVAALIWPVEFQDLILRLIGR
jgi:hypothetical protein